MFCLKMIKMDIHCHCREEGDFGKCIEKAYRNKEFERLSDESRNVYFSLTSWKAWSGHFRNFIERDFLNSDGK